MNYDIFDDMGEFPEAPEERQRFMEEWIEKAFQKRSEEGKNRINEWMMGEPVCCSEKDKMLQVRFFVEDWMLNPMDVLQGGLTATAFDMTCGLLSRYLFASSRTSTIELNINYLSPLKNNDTFVVCTQAKKAGGKLLFLHGEIYQEKDKRLAATASGIFIRQSKIDKS